MIKMHQLFLFYRCPVWNMPVMCAWDEFDLTEVLVLYSLTYKIITEQTCQSVHRLWSEWTCQVSVSHRLLKKLRMTFMCSSGYPCQRTKPLPGGVAKWTTPSCSRRWSLWRRGHSRWWLHQHSRQTPPLWPRWCGRSPCDGTCAAPGTPACRGWWKSPPRWCLREREMILKYDCNDESCH